jgi:hypothetical protein
MVGVKFDSDPGVTIRRIHAFDGATGVRVFSPNVEGPGQGWEPNKNFFDLPDQPKIWGVSEFRSKSASTAKDRSRFTAQAPISWSEEERAAGLSLADFSPIVR